jgi:cystathionine beta-lyase
VSDFDFDTLMDRRAIPDCRKWNRYLVDTLPMWVADMDFAVPEPIQAALYARLLHPVFGYAGPPASLIEAILEMLEARYCWKVTPEAIVMLPGVEPGFNMALRGLLSPGEAVVVQTPIYAPIRAAPLHWGLRRIEVPLQPTPSGFAANLPALQRAFSELGTKAFLLCNPHNPTGKVYDTHELTSIGTACLKHDILIISDEIHGDLVYEGACHRPIAAIAPEIAEQSITLMSASKTYNIAGLKAAFAIIPNQSLRQAFVTARAGMVDSVNLMGMVATEAALRGCEAWRRAVMAYLQANRDFLASEITRRFPMIGFRPPQASFLAWLDCRHLSLHGDPAEFLLEQARIAVSGGEEFGALGAGHVRLNFGCRRATLVAALDRVEQALSNR